MKRALGVTASHIKVLTGLDPSKEALTYVNDVLKSYSTSPRDFSRRIMDAEYLTKLINEVGSPVE